MNKRLLSFLSAAALVAAAASCEPVRPERCGDCAEGLGGLRRVTVALDGVAIPRTKADGVTDTLERVVRSSRLYVFTGDGYQINNWDASSGEVDCYLTDGTYEFVAVCNFNDLPGVEATRDELLATMAPIDSNSTAPDTGGFVMVGTLPDHIVKADEKITVLVERLVSKVSFNVRADFDGYMKTLPFIIEAVYMTNVAGSANLGPEHVKLSAGDVWYNRLDYEPRDTTDTRMYPEEMLYGALDKVLKPGDSMCSGPVFYIYPNPCGDCRDTLSWSPRCTRFVLKARINGIPTYYAVTIDEAGHGVMANRHYHVDATIRDWGTDHPEDVSKSEGAMDMTVTVAGWAGGAEIPEEY